MNPRIAICLIFSCCSISAGFADDPTGWDDIAWGSAKSAIEKVEGAEAVEEPTTELFRGEELTHEFTLEEYHVAGIPYAVKFYFDRDERFAAYTLAFSDDDEERVKAAYEEVADLLHRRYKSSSSSNNELHFGGKNLVRSRIKEVSDGDWEILITYLDPNDEEVDKL